MGTEPSMTDSKRIVVTGVTGRQGGAVARHLLQRGWKVQGLVRRPNCKAARDMAALGVELIAGNLDDRDSLVQAFSGAYGVFAVTNFWTEGIAKEREQGLRMAEVAKECGVQHFVFTSGGAADRGTGVPQIESKHAIEQHIWALNLPATVLRPNIFMEVLTDTAFFPPLFWGMMQSVIGKQRPLNWTAVEDIGAAAAEVFEDRERFLGRTLTLVSETRTMDECLRLFAQVDGRKPWALTLPTWMVKRLVSKELVALWEWMRDDAMEGSVAETREIHRQVVDMETWLRAKRGQLELDAEQPLAHRASA